MRFPYQCITGYCDSTYGSNIVGTSENSAEACSNDYPNCKGYVYSPTNSTGKLCSSVQSNGTILDYQICVQIQGYIDFNEI